MKIITTGARPLWRRLSKNPFRGLVLLFLFSCLVSCGEEEAIQYQEPALHQPQGDAHQGHAHTEKAIPWTWTVPENWKEAPNTSRFRIVSFVAESEQGKGDVSLIQLAGDGGGTLANVNRWLGQIERDPVTSEKLKEMLEERTCPLGKYEFVALRGKDDSGSGILASMVPIEHGILYVKMTTPLASMDAHRNAFVAFCDSLSPTTKPHP